MGFGVSFIGGMADQANRDYAQNSQDARDQINQASNWFDTQIMPAYRKQQQSAADIADRYSKYIAIQGVTPDVAKRAAVDTGHDYTDIDLANMSKGSASQPINNAGPNPTQPNSGTQQPSAPGLGQTNTGQPQGPTPGNLPGGTTTPEQPPAPQLPGQPVQNTQGTPPQPVQPPNGGQAMPPQGGLPQAPQQAPSAPAQGMQQPQQGQPLQQQQQDPKGIMNQIGDLLTGKVGNSQVREQFLQQAAQKYGMDKGQILDLINHVNNPQAHQGAAPGSVAAVPTVQQGLDVAKQFESPAAATAALHGNPTGALQAESDKSDSDYDSVRADNLADAKSLIQAKSAAEAAKASANGGNYDPDTLHNMATIALLNRQDPNFGMNAPKDRANFQNMKTQVMKENNWSPGDVVSMQAAVRSGAQGLGQLEKTRDMTESYANNAVLGANQALTLIGDSANGPTNSDVVNRWIQGGRTDISGDKEVTALNQYVTTLASEYGRIMTGAYGAAGSTDAATARGDALLNSFGGPNKLPTQIKAALQEINNRRYGQNQAVDTVRQYIGSGGQNNGFAKPFETSIPANNPLSDQNPSSPGYNVTGPGRPNATPSVTKVNTEDDYNSVAPGQSYIDPNGVQKIKPKAKQ